MVVPNRNLLYTNHISVYERKYFDSHVVFYSAVTVRSTALFLSSYPRVPAPCGTKRLFLYTPLLSLHFLGHSAFYSEAPVNKSPMALFCRHPVISLRCLQIVKLRRSSLPGGCAHVGNKKQKAGVSLTFDVASVKCPLCLKMNQTWQPAPLCQVGPNHAGGYEGQWGSMGGGGTDTAGMVARNRSGQLGQY